MGGEETVVAATIVVDDIDEDTYLWVVGRSPSGNQRFDNGVVDGSCQTPPKPAAPNTKKTCETALIERNNILEPFLLQLFQPNRPVQNFECVLFLEKKTRTE